MIGNAEVKLNSGNGLMGNSSLEDSAAGTISPADSVMPSPEEMPRPDTSTSPVAQPAATDDSGQKRRRHHHHHRRLGRKKRRALAYIIIDALGILVIVAIWYMLNSQLNAPH
jgi:hypothetical protein